jgi:sulfopyruvate decarboxylase subunit beta
MKHAEYFETIRSHWRDEVVVCALGTTADQWWEATQSDAAFYVNAAMGFAASFALGLALNSPGLRVLMLDSDGSLCMNLGGLLTEASQQPPNLLHLVLNNHGYGCLGNARLVNAALTDYVGIARAAGITGARGVATAMELAEALSTTPGYGFIVADVEPAEQRVGFEPPLAIPFDGPEAKYRFARHLEARTGKPVFGPHGY